MAKWPAIPPQALEACVHAAAWHGLPESPRDAPVARPPLDHPRHRHRRGDVDRLLDAWALLGYITHRLNPSPLPARRLDAAPRRPAERVVRDAQLELGVVVLPLRLRRARDLPHESVGARRQLLWSSAATQSGIHVAGILWSLATPPWSRGARYDSRSRRFGPAPPPCSHRLAA